ncbi:MAG TPA: beta-N-acetylhexosaminidase, partial [Mucilaginibacter sp.]|nr:beta-N-acetylhexosaminidase [Mucilaginibacter sp.]
MNHNLKKFLGLIGCCVLALQSFGQSTREQIAIIPEPVSIAQHEGEYLLPKNIVISAPHNPEMKEVIATLRERFSVPTGAHVTVLAGAASPAIKLILNKTADTTIGKEGYYLSVEKKGIVIRANEPAGLYYGVQTLVQLFPKEIVSSKRVEGVKWAAPYVDITDYPRFKWRGLMLDVARHFFTKQEVEHYIDNMATYKFNLLHMH